MAEPGTLQGLVAAGHDHTCAVTVDQTVRCWGDNWAGQLGNATTTPSNVPVDVPGLTRVASLALGEAHSCALGTGGGVFCWGYNERGQLGDGTTDNRDRPTRVSGIDGPVAEIVAGANHTCARTRAQSVYCWGDNGFGQLAAPLSIAFVTEPRLVQTLAQLSIGLVAGRWHSCSLGQVSQMHCWGYNNSGQLGDGTTVNRTVPVAVEQLTRPTLATAGWLHTCALPARGKPRCWGGNGAGQLGNGTTARSFVPVLVSNLRRAQAVAMTSGGAFNCALGRNGRIWCWGLNTRGQLGAPVDGFSTVPVRVTRLGTSTPVAIASGENHSCALLQNGRIRCWGSNASGQLGNGRQGGFRIRPSLVRGDGFGPPA